MKVQELRDILKNCNPNADVCLDEGDGLWPEQILGAAEINKRKVNLTCMESAVRYVAPVNEDEADFLLSLSV